MVNLEKHCKELPLGFRHATREKIRRLDRNIEKESAECHRVLQQHILREAAR